MSVEELRQAGKDAESAKDYEKAMEYYQQAAEKGVAASIYGIGYLYCNGLGVEQSYERAAEYYRQAAEAGLEEAVDELKALAEAGHISEEYLEGLGE